MATDESIRTRLARIESELSHQSARENGFNLQSLSDAELRELGELVEKIEPPESFASHGNGSLEKCECRSCQHRRAYVASGGTLTDAESERLNQLTLKVRRHG